MKPSKKDLIRIRDMLIADVESSNISVSIVYTGNTWDMMTISAVQPDILEKMKGVTESPDYL